MSDLDALVAEIHKACRADNPPCGCACGCDERIGCTCWARVCVPCQINWMRDRDPEPGKPDCAPPARLTSPG